MPLIAVESKRRRGASGLFTTDGVHLNRKQAKRFRNTYRRKTFGRFFGSWAALMLGLFSCFTAMHYAPSLFHGKGKIAASSSSGADFRLGMKDDSVLGPYLALFKLNRTYMRRGQVIQAQYNLPEGGTLDLSITKCEKAVIIEVYRCNPVSQQSISVQDRSGARTFRIKDNAFYHFNHTSNATDYRVVWKRG